MSERIPGPGRHRRRPAVALLTAAALLATPAAEAAQRCPNVQQQAMYEVAALKTELMVVATACREEQRYNDFVTRYRAELGENDKALLQHFTRSGRAGQRAYDAYITNLANARAKLGQDLGSDFCPRNAGLFSEVMSLTNGSDLFAYAAGKDLIPATLGACESAQPAPAAAPRQAASRNRASAR